MTSLIAIAAIFFDQIVDVLIQSYELSVSCLLVPVVVALFRKNGNFLSALLSIVLGGMGFVFFRIFPIEFPREIASLVLSALGYLCGTASFREKVLKRASREL